jgi:alpha-glucosidase
LTPDWQTLNVEQQLADPGSLLNLYRRLLALRKASPALQYGDYQAVDAAPEDCYVYFRQTADQRFLVALNFSGQAQTLDLPAPGTGTLRAGTDLARPLAVVEKQLELRENEGVIIEYA